MSNKSKLKITKITATSRRDNAEKSAKVKTEINSQKSVQAKTETNSQKSVQSKAETNPQKPTQAKAVTPVSNQPKSKFAKSPKTKKSKVTATPEKPLKEVFLLARPFVALGRYLRDSWRELRQVRWPNRKATWKMTLAVIIYCAIFIAFLVLLDTLFTFIFNLLLGNN